PERAPLPAARAADLGLPQAHAGAARRAVRLDPRRQLAAWALERLRPRLDDARRLDVDRALGAAPGPQQEEPLALLGELVCGALGGTARAARARGRFSLGHRGQPRIVRGRAASRDRRRGGGPRHSLLLPASSAPMRSAW